MSTPDKGIEAIAAIAARVKKRQRIIRAARKLTQRDVEAIVEAARLGWTVREIAPLLGLESISRLSEAAKHHKIPWPRSTGRRPGENMSRQPLPPSITDTFESIARARKEYEALRVADGLEGPNARPLFIAHDDALLLQEHVEMGALSLTDLAKRIGVSPQTLTSTIERCRPRPARAAPPSTPSSRPVAGPGPRSAPEARVPFE